MKFIKKWIIFILYYLISSLFAILGVSFLSLIFKLLKITVQGPTVFSSIAEIVVFYICFSILSFFLFKNYGKKHKEIKKRELIVFYGSVLLLHFTIIFYGRWNSIYTITNGSLPLAIRLYSGTFERTHGRLYLSLRDIPRIYYYIGLSIEDFCFIIFSLTGYLIGRNSTVEKKI
ncbi:MAG: hypothetical protein GX752_04515 [Clostridium sp.]|nr:hypothetical protein [Clostridium sp.]